MTGADIYRLNCQGCHRAEGTGAPPEIKSVLSAVQGSSLALVREQLRAQGKDPAEGAARVAKARADLYTRIQKGGQRMPPLDHLQRADIDLLYAYLTELAHSPDGLFLTLRPWLLAEHDTGARQFRDRVEQGLVGDPR